ncbi:MAG: hypothetical protein C5B51_14580 [Terriglobia bacterium]|nr:MAG: hypothetical protein C5B51_14580 [Terriglobia bacterium]
MPQGALLLLCIARLVAAQEAVPTQAERDLAAKLGTTPESQVEQAIAALDDSLVTAGLARALGQSGDPLINSNRDSAHALLLYRLSIEVAKRGGFALIEANAHAGAGAALSHLARLEESMESYSRALALYRQEGAPASRMASALGNRGNVRRDLGDLSGALEDAESAARIWRQLGEEVGLARVLNSIGLVHRVMGDNRGAMQSFEQSLAIAERRNEKLGQAYLLNNMSELWLAQGEYAFAETYALRSLKIKEALGDQQEIGSTLTNLAYVYHRAGKEAQAEESLARTIQLGRDTGRKIVEAGALGELGLFALERKDYAKALRNCMESVRLLHETGDRMSEVRYLGYVAAIHLAQHEYRKALEFANRGRDMARELGATPEVPSLSLVAGQAYRALGDRRQARTGFEEAVRAIEQQRDLLAGDRFTRESFLADHIKPFRELVSLEAEDGHGEAALAWAERAKGRVLLDVITGGRSAEERVITAAERAREAQLSGRVASLSAQLRRAAEEPAGNTVPHDLEARLDKARVDLAAFRAQIYAAHPELEIRRGDIHPVSAEQAVPLLPDANAAILEYAVTPQATYLFVIERGQPVRVYTLRMAAEEWRRQAAELQEKLATRDPEFASASARLYQALLGPARAQLKDKKLLILAPDGDLWQVPFQALRSPEGHYLIEGAAIFYTPSLSVLHALSNRKQQPGKQGGTLAAFANPTSDWQEAEHEASRLAALYGVASSRTWLRANATEEAFRANAGRYDVLHVAAHGIFDNRHPLYSHLVFHSPAGQDPQDGLLEAGEIRGLDLNASLVVLSGCETARGQFEEGEGAIGMTWAFLAAGSRAVAASQWRVESTSTTQLMLAFHTALRQGLGKAVALRQAMLEVMRSETFRHPFYWAGFAVFGDGY